MTNHQPEEVGVFLTLKTPPAYIAMAQTFKSEGLAIMSGEKGRDDTGERYPFPVATARWIRDLIARRDREIACLKAELEALRGPLPPEQPRAALAEQEPSTGPVVMSELSTRVAKGVVAVCGESPTFEGICSHSGVEFLREPNFGRKSLNDLKDWLYGHGRALRPHYDAIDPAVEEWRRRAYG